MSAAGAERRSVHHPQRCVLCSRPVQRSRGEHAVKSAKFSGKHWLERFLLPEVLF